MLYYSSRIWILNEKLSPYYFIHLLFVQLTVYKRTITRFIADDKVVYQRVRYGRCKWFQTIADHDVV